ncbi:MAG TPA: hypothetical protein VLG67_03465 [Candidatus Saccharimonadales bacterium]|nr:hypothetical protein [Candidatus Saccharimonadales bacterium]
MKKQNIYLLIAAALILVIFLIFLIIQSTSGKQQAQNSTTSVTPTANTTNFNQYSNPNNTSNSNLSPTLDPSLPPDLVTKDFYNYYLSLPANAASTGEYKKYSRVSHELIDYVENQYQGSNDPIFCVENKYRDVIFNPPIYNSDGNVSYVDIKENINGGRLLYSVELDRTSKGWVIATTQCL